MAVPNSCSTVSGFQGPRPPRGGLPRQAARLYITRVPRPPQGPVSHSIIPPYFIIKAILSKLELSALASTYTKDMKPSALKTIASFCRNEAVLCIAFVCALISSFFVPAGHDFTSSVDLRVIVLLFCLMGATAGLQNAGVLSRSAHCLLSKVSGLRQLGFLLVALPFFASMIVTNDVALLAFVPFAILTLSITDKKRHLPRIVVLQAVAANIGGMVTPVGNPQNLFIYTAFQTPFLQFFLTLLPFALATFFALAVVCLTFPRESIHVSVSFGSEPIRRSKALIHSVLFLLCLAAAVRILPYSALLPVTLLALLLFDRGIYRKINYGLLATFFCFFVFSGNMSSIPFVQATLGSAMNAAPFSVALAASQVISNVPAAVLLSQFTSNWPALLLGVDLGGLGTPIASLASLIAMRLYLHTPEARLSTFLKEFAVANVAFLALLCALYLAFKAFYPM